MRAGSSVVEQQKNDSATFARVTAMPLGLHVNLRVVGANPTLSIMNDIVPQHNNERGLTMPTDNVRKDNLDELTVLSKCLMGTPMPGNEGLAAQLRAAILTILGRLGHGDISHTIVLASIDPDVLDRFARVVAVVSGPVEQNPQWLDSNCATVRAQADFLQDAKVGDQRSQRWADIAARALVAAHVTRGEP